MTLKSSLVILLIDSKNTFTMQKEMRRMHPDQFLDSIDNLPNHSKQHMVDYGLSLHQGSLESRETLEQNLSFRSPLLISTASTNTLHSTNLFLFSHHHVPTNGIAPLSAYKHSHNPHFLHLL